MLDEIDKAILEGCKATPGSQLRDIIALFLNLRTERSIRLRVSRLADLGYMQKDHKTERGKVFCYITDLGEKELVGRTGRSPSEDGERL